MNRNLKRLTAVTMAAAVAVMPAAYHSLSIPAAVMAADKKADTKKADTKKADTKAIAVNAVTQKTNGTDGSLFKEETVYVTAGPDGTPEKTIVSDWLKNAGTVTEVMDVSSLSGIENVKGDEKFTAGDSQKLTWNTEGADIYYQGITKQPAPVGVKITYRLSGKEISPESLKGKSGKLEMNIRYLNDQKQTVDINGKSIEMYTPFTMVSAMMLSTDHFTNVNIDHGKVLSDADKDIVIGVGFPGLKENLDLSDKENLDLEIPDSVTVTADVKDFEMGAVFTAAASDVMDVAGLSDVQNFEELNDAITKLSDASKELLDGTNTLSDGTDTLAGKSVELKDGINQLSDGITAYTTGISSLYLGTTELRSGVQSLQGGAGQLMEGAKSLDVGLASAKDGADQLAAGYEAGVVEGAQSLSDGTVQLNAAAAEMAGQLAQAEGMLPSGEEMETLANLGNVVGNQAGAGAADGAVDGAKQVICGAAGQLGLTEEQTAALCDALEGQKGEIADAVGSAVTDAVNAQTGSVGEKLSRLGELSAIAGSVGELQNITQQLSDGAATLNSGIGRLYSGTKELQSGIGALQEGAGRLTDGISAAEEGINSLEAGAGTLEAGAKTLNDSGSQITDGASKLQAGGDQLTSGTGELAEGAKTLKNGMSEFKTTGIDKLSEVFHGDISEIKDRIDKMSELGTSYQTFSGKDSSMNGSAKFIIETKEIK